MAHILGAAAVTATMAQGPQTPWNNDHEAELYAEGSARVFAGPVSDVDG